MGRPYIHTSPFFSCHLYSMATPGQELPEVQWPEEKPPGATEGPLTETGYPPRPEKLPEGPWPEEPEGLWPEKLKLSQVPWPEKPCPLGELYTHIMMLVTNVTLFKANRHRLYFSPVPCVFRATRSNISRSGGTVQGKIGGELTSEDPLPMRLGRRTTYTTRRGECLGKTRRLWPPLFPRC